MGKLQTCIIINRWVNIGKLNFIKYDIIINKLK